MIKGYIIQGNTVVSPKPQNSIIAPLPDDDAIAEVAVEDLDEAEGIGLSFSLCNAWVAAECLAA